MDRIRQKTSAAAALTFFERFLAYMTVTSFMLGLASLIKPFVNNPETERILINWFTYLVISLSGLLFIIIQQIFAREKIKSILHVLVIVFYVILAVILCFVCSQLNQPYLLIPFLIIQYLLQNVLNNLFVYHDRFIDECGTLGGKELVSHLFHNNLSAIDFGIRARIATALLVILPLIIFLITLIIYVLGYSAGIISLCFMILFLCGEFLIFFMTGLYKNDIFFAFLGFRNYVQNRKSLFGSGLLILLVTCLFAFLISSNKALIKINLNENKNIHYSQQVPEVSSFEVDAASALVEMLEEAFPDDGKFPVWIWDLIFGILKWGLICFFAVALIIFFIKPFLSAGWKQYWKEGRFNKFLKNLWDEITSFFKYAFMKNKNDIPYSTVESRKFSKGIKDFLKKAGRSKEKNEEIDRLTKHFMKLIDWGQSQGIKYSPNLAPAEYTDLIYKKYQQDGETVPDADEIMKAVKLSGLLFEKALYDKNLLSKDEEKQFIEAIEKVMQ